MISKAHIKPERETHDSADSQTLSKNTLSSESISVFIRVHLWIHFLFSATQPRRRRIGLRPARASAFPKPAWPWRISRPRTLLPSPWPHCSATWCGRTWISAASSTWSARVTTRCSRPGRPPKSITRHGPAAPASAQLLAFGNFSVNGSNVEIQAWLNDVRDASLPPVIGKVYRGEATESQVRTFAHQFADEIIGKLSGGLPGIAEHADRVCQQSQRQQGNLGHGL